MTCSEKLGTDQHRAHVKNFLNRTMPGIRHTFMRNGSLRDGVTIYRQPRKLKVTI